MQVVVLHSELSESAAADEQDVLVQSEAVSKALHDLGYEVDALPFSLNLAAVETTLRRLQPQFVFNLVETVNGSGRLIHLAPALLDHSGIRYTGAPTEAVFITSNKILSKRMLLQSGIRTPAWWDLSESGDDAPFQPGHYVVKSLWEHASVGLDEDSVVYASSPHDLTGEMTSRKDSLGGACFAEAYIDGREFNLSLLGDRGGEPTVLPPAEICFDHFPAEKKKVVGYRAKWETESFEYQNTRRSFELSAEDGPLLRELQTIARQCWRLFGLRGYARVDFRIDLEGNPWVLEVNTNPCLSPDAGFVAASEKAGLGLPATVQRIVEHSDCGAPLPRFPACPEPDFFTESAAPSSI